MNMVRNDLAKTYKKLAQTQDSLVSLNAQAEELGTEVATRENDISDLNAVIARLTKEAMKLRKQKKTVTIDLNAQNLEKQAHSRSRDDDTDDRGDTDREGTPATGTSTYSSGRLSAKEKDPPYFYNEKDNGHGYLRCVVLPHPEQAEA